MNIQVYGRIRSMTKTDQTPLHLDLPNKISSRIGGPIFSFQTLHTQQHTTYDVFKQSFLPLVDLFIEGNNTSILIGGESGSGKSFSMSGADDRGKSGLMPLIFDHLFAALSKGKQSSNKKNTLTNPKVFLEMYEVYNEVIKDLFAIPQDGTGYIDLGEDATRGVYVRNATQIQIKDATKASEHFRQAWGRRTEATSDVGPSYQNASVFCRVHLEVNVAGNSQPIKCRFTVVELPGLEKLSQDFNYLSVREGPDLSKALSSLTRVVSALSSNPYPDRVIDYNNSKLTQLLQEELGGNCTTKALICLKPESNTDVVDVILKFCNDLAQVKTFPVINNFYAQGLLTQHRAMQIELKHQSGVKPIMTSTTPLITDPTSEIRRLQTENLVLQDQNERLSRKLDQLGNKFGHVANTKTDLSQQLLLSEEEKLKVSQSLVELEIENNKVKEDAEATHFELTNKIILLENQLVEAQNDRDKHSRAAKSAKEKLNEIESERKDLSDEYVILKTNFLSLSQEHKKECSRNENLAIELLNLVNNKAALMRQVIILTNGDSSTLDDPNAEIARIRAIINNNSSGKIKTDEILGTQRDRELVEERLFASKRKFESEINRLKDDYGSENKKSEARLHGLMKELADTRVLSRERGQKISELNAKLITLRGEKDSIETQVNRLQHKVKDLGEDFRARLVKYVEDIAEHVDKGNGVPGQAYEKRMRDYCDSMLKDIRRSHKEREDQLSVAAQNFKKRLQSVVHSYEQVLIAYRNLRQTCQARGFDRSDLGPDEDDLKIGDSEIQSSHLKELDRAKGELGKVKTELDAVKLRYGLFGENGKENFSDLNTISARSDLWGALRKQLREFTLNTQQQLEQERARLLSENSVLQQQLKESQEYIDSHLVRYKQEIIRLRGLLGMSEVDPLLSYDRPPKNKRK